MIPDPDTEEGKKEIARRIKKIKEEAEKFRELAKNCDEDEPTGKLTNPSDIDRVRDRKNDE